MYLRLALALLLTLTALPAQAAMVYIDSPTDMYGPGDSFIATVRLDPQNDCINAGHVVVTFPRALVKAVDFSRGDSIFTMWIADPVFDNENGQVVFEAGVPGGYCGRIQGDPSLTNVLGKIVFTVQAYDEKPISISPSLLSELYVSDGAGSRAALEVTPALVTLIPTSNGAPNAWLDEIRADKLPPEPFTVTVESTEDVFYGNYYAVFSTVDKQSGISHYEIFERGVWKRVESPHKLYDQALQKPVQVRAIDKAGNERMGDYFPETVPERKARSLNPIFFVVGLIVLGGVGVYILTSDKGNTSVA